MTEISVLKKLIARNIPGDELIPGNIKRIYPDKRYDVSTGSTEVMRRVKPCPQALGKDFNLNDPVLMLLPGGLKCNAEIWDKSNTAYPEEHLAEFSTEPEAETTGTIYLCCPDESKIKVYSTDGTAGTDISPGSNALYNICSDGTYLYCSFNSAYAVFKIKLDGKGETEIVTQSRYYYACGLAIDPTSTYLYQFDCPNNSIARITISDGTIEDTWKEITEGTSIESVSDICGDSNYIYIFANFNTVDRAVVKIYDFEGNYINEFSVDAIAGYKITADGTYLYIASDADVAIYTISGSLIKIIEGIV